MVRSVLLAGLTIVGMVISCVAMPFMVYREWRTAIRLLGFRRAIRAGWRTGSLRLRQPTREVLLTAPGFSSLVPLVLAGVLVFAMSGGPERARTTIVALGLGCALAFLKRAPNPALPMLLLAMLAAVYAIGDLIVMRLAMGLAVLSGMVAVCQPLLGLVPPIVLFLGSSDYAGFLIMKRLQALGPFQVLSLIDQASPGVSQEYPAHYGGLGPDPTGPRVDSLRTRTKWWKPTVRELMETTPILVLDTRIATPAVVGEVGWALSPDLYGKTLFLVGDDGTAPAFDVAIPPWTDRGILQRQMVTEAELYDRVRERTHSRAALLSDGAGSSSASVSASAAAVSPALQRLFHDVGAQERSLRGLRQLLFAKDVTDPDIDRAFATIHPGLPDPDEAHAPLAISTSLEQALLLARRRFPACTISLHIHHNGLAKAEVGLWDAAGGVRVFTSEDDITPPKAVLHAMLEAELDEM